MLSSVLASQVSKSSRARGLAYFEVGAVEDLSIGDAVITAVVVGNDYYDVAIEPRGPTLRVSCTCPYFTEHGEICKHVWAALLAAEAQGLALVPQGQAAAHMILVPVDSYDPIDLDVDGALEVGPPSRSVW